MSKSGPPVESALQDQRIKRMKEKIAQQAFIEVILQILFAAVIFSISYVNRDDRFYRQKENIDNYLYACSKTQYGFSKVSCLFYVFQFLFSRNFSATKNNSQFIFA